VNTLKTAFLLTALTLFLIFIGAWVGGRDGMILAFFIAAGMNFFSYFYSDKLALSMVLTSSIAATLAGAVTLLAHFSGMLGGRGSRSRGAGILMFFLAPLAATLIQLAVSRSREYEADATGAHTTGNPYALASALQKLETYSRRLPLQASPSTAHLFIVAPLISGASFANLFSTHPPMAKRIERLTGRAPL